MAVKIAFANAKGGVGKTTSAVCTAQELQRLGKKVLLIDTDAQKNASWFYDAASDNVGTMVDVLYAEDIDASQCIQHLEYGDIIAAEQDLANAETMIRPDEYRSLHMKRACKSLDKLYDYIIVDTPPAAGVVLRSVLAYVDYVIIPVDEGGWSVTGLMNFYKTTIHQAQDVTNPNLKVGGILLVKMSPVLQKTGQLRSREGRAIREAAYALAPKLETTVFDTMIRETSAAKEAMTSFRVPLYQYDKSNKTQKDYEAFTLEMTKRFEGGK